MASRLDHLYDEDFFAWTQLQAKELRKFARTRPNLPLDLPHIALELADLGKEQRNALRTWSIRIIEHLLLLEHSRASGPRHGWRKELRNFRNDVDERLSATLRRDLERQLPRLYDKGRRNAEDDLIEYGEDAVADRLPATCPYTLDQVIGDWWPDEPGRSSENA